MIIIKRSTTDFLLSSSDLLFGFRFALCELRGGRRRGRRTGEPLGGWRRGKRAGEPSGGWRRGRKAGEPIRRVEEGRSA